jgi:hypothetical protein
MMMIIYAIIHELKICTQYHSEPVKVPFKFYDSTIATGYVLILRTLLRVQKRFTRCF